MPPRDREREWQQDRQWGDRHRERKWQQDRHRRGGPRGPKKEKRREQELGAQEQEWGEQEREHHWDRPLPPHQHQSNLLLRSGLILLSFLNKCSESYCL